LEKTRTQFKAVDLEIRRLCKEEYRVIESKEDKQLKETAIAKINEIVSSWMQRINEQMGISSSSANNQARVLCFGSYKLGVSSPKGDIDAIVLTPIYVDREKHFFGTLFEILFEYSKNNANIKNLQAVNT
jgi:poly(A) polymerase